MHATHRRRTLNFTIVGTLIAAAFVLAAPVSAAPVYGQSHFGQCASTRDTTTWNYGQPRNFYPGGSGAKLCLHQNFTDGVEKTFLFNPHGPAGCGELRVFKANWHTGAGGQVWAAPTSAPGTGCAARLAFHTNGPIELLDSSLRRIWTNYATTPNLPCFSVEVNGNEADPLAYEHGGACGEGQAGPVIWRS